MRNRSHPVWAVVVIILLVAFLAVLLLLPLEEQLGIQLPRQMLIFIALLTVIAILLVGGYLLNWAWTGFGPQFHPKLADQEYHRGKTLWDWMQLLIVPAVLATAAFLFNTWNADIQREISEDNQREAALQTYLDKMSELLVGKGASDPKASAGTQIAARTRTLTLLRRLDADRQRILLQFLRDSELFTTTRSAIDLNGADLRGVAMRGADLHQVNLGEANLSSADLSGANLNGADLSGASLQGAKLNSADLRNSNLAESDLCDANLALADLSESKINTSNLSGTNFHSANLSSADLGNSNLGGAILSEANLNLANLSSANLLNASMQNANLWRADLSGAILWNTNLSGANLTEANLVGADLRNANLAGVRISPEQLANVKSLKGATMPDRTTHN